MIMAVFVFFKKKLINTVLLNITTSISISRNKEKDYYLS